MDDFFFLKKRELASYRRRSSTFVVSQQSKGRNEVIWVKNKICHSVILSKNLGSLYRLHILETFPSVLFEIFYLISISLIFGSFRDRKMRKLGKNGSQVRSAQKISNSQNNREHQLRRKIKHHLDTTLCLALLSNSIFPIHYWNWV